MDGFLEEVPGLVDDEASPEPVTEADETTPESDPDGQPAQEEAKPEVKTYEVEIDGEVVQATAEQIKAWRTDATNMSAMSASATQKYQEAAKLRDEVEAKLNDPEYQRLKNVDAMLREHPETLAEFQRLAAHLENPQPMPQQYPGQPIPNPVNMKMAYENTTLKSRLQETEHAKRVAELEAQVDAFRSKHEMSDEDFGAMYEAMKAEVAPEVLDSPNFGEVLEYYHFKNFGSVESQVKVAEAREEGANEAAAKIAEGKAVGGVAPSGHVTQDWQPPKEGPDGMEASRRAAMDDPEIQFDGAFPG